MRRIPGWLPTCTTLFAGQATRARLDAFRDRRLRDLVAHAYRNVPHYRETMRAHAVRPESIRGVADIHKLPILSRQTVQEHADRLLCSNIDPTRLHSIWSAGSTGRNVTIYHTPAERLILGALRARVDATLGRHPRMRAARVTLVRGSRKTDWRVRAARSVGFFRSTEIDAREDPAHIAEQLRRLRPDTVGGFPAVLTRVAEVVGPDGLADLNIRAVIVGGAVLTHAMRETIAQAFAAPVRETYNCVEFINLASECTRSHHLHVCDENVVLEVLRGDRAARSGEPGEVVVTGLHQYAMPLIRYRLGDVVTPGAPTCPCGSPHATIHQVRGRMNDYFRLPRGRIVHSWALSTDLLASHAWVGRYRVTQEREDRVVLTVEPRATPSTAEIDAVNLNCRRVLGPEVSFALELVDQLPDDADVKFRVSRSLVASDYDNLDWNRVEDARARAQDD